MSRDRRAIDRRAVAWVGFAIRLAAAGIWIAAGAAKLPDIRSFQIIVSRYGILPASLAGPFAWALPFVEIGVGLYLAAGLFVRASAVAGTFLFAVFLSAQGYAWARGLTLDCGCFGTVVQSTVGPLTMLRDLSLGVPTFVMAAFPARALSLDNRLFDAPDRFSIPPRTRKIAD